MGQLDWQSNTLRQGDVGHGKWVGTQGPCLGVGVVGTVKSNASRVIFTWDPLWTDRRLWKHYLRAISLAGGNKMLSGTRSDTTAMLFLTINCWPNITMPYYTSSQLQSQLYIYLHLLSSSCYIGKSRGTFGVTANPLGHLHCSAVSLIDEWH